MNKIYSEQKTLEQFAGVGGYDEASDPPLWQTTKIFRLLCQRIDVANATRIAFDPKASIKTVAKTAGREYKRLMKELDKDSIGGKMLRQMGIGSYIKAAEVMVNIGEAQTPEDWPSELRSVASVTATTAIHARENLGARKLAELHGALSFCRCVSGKPKKAGAVYVAWICPHCKSMPARDFVWNRCTFNADGLDNKNAWFCALVASNLSLRLTASCSGSSSLMIRRKSAGTQLSLHQAATRISLAT